MLLRGRASVAQTLLSVLLMLATIEQIKTVAIGEARLRFAAHLPRHPIP
jgi:hypothetical protein